MRHTKDEFFLSDHASLYPWRRVKKGGRLCTQCRHMHVFVDSCRNMHVFVHSCRNIHVFARSCRKMVTDGVWHAGFRSFPRYPISRHVRFDQAQVAQRPAPSRHVQVCLSVCLSDSYIMVLSLAHDSTEYLHVRILSLANDSIEYLHGQIWQSRANLGVILLEHTHKHTHFTYTHSHTSSHSFCTAGTSSSLSDRLHVHSFTHIISLILYGRDKLEPLISEVMDKQILAEPNPEFVRHVTAMVQVSCRLTVCSCRLIVCSCRLIVCSCRLTVCCCRLTMCSLKIPIWHHSFKTFVYNYSFSIKIHIYIYIHI